MPVPIPHSRPWLTAADHAAVAAALNSGWLSDGEEVRRLEAECAAADGGAGGIATACGRAALRLALETLGVAGREVLLPTYVCGEVESAVIAAGAEPVFCDVGPAWLMTPATVAARLSARTAAIILVHLFGRRVEAETFRGFGVPLIEDACQAFGVARGAGSMATAYSFHATKCLCGGEGGLLTSADPAFLRAARKLVDQNGGEDRLLAPLAGLNAALVRSQLRRYPEMLARRIQIAERYRQALADRAVESAAPPPGSVPFRFTLRQRAAFPAVRARFLEAGVHVRQGVDALLHRRHGEPDARFPQAAQLLAQTVSLPLYPGLTEEEIQRCLAAMRRVLADGEAHGAGD